MAEYDVAVKALIQKSSEMDKIKLLQEAAIMHQFQHPNIVKLFGVVKNGKLVSAEQRSRAEKWLLRQGRIRILFYVLCFLCSQCS